MSLFVPFVVIVACVDLTLGACFLDPKVKCISSSDCLNGGTCSQNLCRCPPFYIGTHCETPFQCKTDTDCLHDGNCTKCSEYFRASCECAAGYEGANCGIIQIGATEMTEPTTVSTITGCYDESDCPVGRSCFDTANGGKECRAELVRK